MYNWNSIYLAEFRNISAIFFFPEKKMQIQYYKQGHQYDTIVLFPILCNQTKIRFKTLKFDLLCFIWRSKSGAWHLKKFPHFNVIAGRHTLFALVFAHFTLKIFAHFVYYYVEYFPSKIPSKFVTICFHEILWRIKGHFWP